MLAGKLEQSRSRTFAGASGRQTSSGVAEDVDNVLVPAPGIDKVEVREDLELQVLRELLAPFGEPADLVGRKAGLKQPAVDGADGVVVRQVEAVGVRQVVDGRDEVMLFVLDGRIAAVGFEYGAVSAEENTQHLALAELLVPLGALPDVQTNIIHNHRKRRMWMI